MIDWLTIVIALVIIACLIGGFGFLAWKISMSDPLARDESNPSTDSTNEKRRKEKNSNEQSKKKRKDQKKGKRETKDEEEKQQRRNKPAQTSEETDDEREESEQELLNAPVQPVETSSKARKRNKNKTRSATPPLSTSESQYKNPNTSRAPPVTHPKSAPKDEHESTKQPAKKQTLPTPVTTKKPSQNVQKQQQQQQQQEDQSFTVVGGNRHKNATPPVQQKKPQVNQTSSAAPVVQQSSTAPVQHEQLAQRLPSKETPTPVAVSTVKQAPPPPKIADLIKVLPSSQAVVTELMSALDAFPLSPDELDIIMHKIANKQSVVKQDWSKLHQGQKVDPQAHIGQVLDESAKAYEDDLKTNSVQRIKELTAELNAEKRRNNDLLKDKSNKEREIQILHAQLDSTQQKTESSSKAPPVQQKLQTLELQLQRVTEDNIHLTQQLAQQTASNVSNTNDAANMKVQVLSEQMKKLSVDNAHWEKKAHSNELLAKEAQKEKEDLIRYNEQLTQSLQKAEKDLKHVEEKHHQQLNDLRTSKFNEMNEYQNRLQQLQNENEQLKREEIVHVEPSTTTDVQTITLNNEEREQLENEIQRLKQTIEDIKQEKNQEQHKELNTLQTELNEVKNRLHQQRQLLTDLLSENLQQQLPNDNQDSDQWLASYRQLSESNKQRSHEESELLKRENVQLHKNMSEIENQLKEIESTVQTKEETLLNDLKNKDAIVDQLRHENDELKNELEHLQSIHHASVSEARALKHQLDERFHGAADESFELVKQLSPSQSPIVIDMRAEQLNELIRSSKEALENQDSVTKQLDKHLNEMHHSGSGEKSTIDDTTVSTSSNQQS